MKKVFLIVPIFLLSFLVTLGSTTEVTSSLDDGSPGTLRDVVTNWDGSSVILIAAGIGDIKLSSDLIIFEEMQIQS